MIQGQGVDTTHNQDYKWVLTLLPHLVILCSLDCACGPRSTKSDLDIDINRYRCICRALLTTCTTRQRQPRRASLLHTLLYTVSLCPVPTTAAPQTRMQMRSVEGWALVVQLTSTANSNTIALIKTLHAAAVLHIIAVTASVRGGGHH